MFSWLMAHYYDRMLRDAEEKCLQGWRKILLQHLSGDVLELGCGTGANLAFYPDTLNHLVLAEPNPHMRRQLASKLISYPNLSAKTINCSAEFLSVPDNSFDAVVCTLLLCSVKNPQQSLAEIYRVLRPNGKLIFIEHIAATNNPHRLKWQKRLEPIWKRVQCNCHLTRDTEKAMLQAGFAMQKITRQSIRGVPPIARPAIWGMAVKI